MNADVNEDLWSVIERAVEEGVTVDQFLRECASHWEEALRRQLKNADAAWSNAIKQGRL